MGIIKKVFTEPRLILTFVMSRYCHWMNDGLYLRILYFIRMGKRLHLNPPRTFNEKLQWLKLNDRHSEYTQMVDKVTSKEYVAGIIGREYIIPTLGVWDNFDDIDFASLPEQFVLKCNHDSGGLIICEDKSQLDINYARKKINKSLKKNFFYGTREYPYKHIKPRIIAEKYMVDGSGMGLTDYKIYCFNGVPKLLLIVSNRAVCPYYDYFDMEFNNLPILWGGPHSPIKIEKPVNLDIMIDLAMKLSKNIPHQVRIDFYNVDECIYFGEITFFDGSGLQKIYPPKWDEILGSWIN